MNTYGLKMAGVLSAVDILKAVNPLEAYYNRETGVLRVYDLDPLQWEYPAEIADDDAWLYIGAFRYPKTPQEIADRIARAVYMASDPAYPIPDIPDEKKPLYDRLRVVNVEQAAYGDWYTYADGHKEFISLGD